MVQFRDRSSHGQEVNEQWGLVRTTTTNLMTDDQSRSTFYVQQWQVLQKQYCALSFEGVYWIYRVFYQKLLNSCPLHFCWMFIVEADRDSVINSQPTFEDSTLNSWSRFHPTKAQFWQKLATLRSEVMSKWIKKWFRLHTFSWATQKWIFKTPSITSNGLLQ